jgi:hypothetical protein
MSWLITNTWVVSTALIIAADQRFRWCRVSVWVSVRPGSEAHLMLLSLLNSHSTCTSANCGTGLNEGAHNLKASFRS